MVDSGYSDPAIRVDKVSKSFGTVKALDRISLSVDRGELFGIVGPDGAGKTTLFRLLTTLLLPDEGRLEVDGFDTVTGYRSIRNRVGYMPGRFSLYPDLSVKENLDFFASVFGTSIEENYHLISDIYARLMPFAGRKAAKLSGGMKQKLALCCALIHSPKVLFLDEPTTGVDPSSRREFWEILARLKQEGITILVSTAYMDEAVRCDRVAMMMHGRMLVDDRPEEIVGAYDKTLYAVRAKDMYRLLLDLRGRDDIERCYTFGDVHHVVLPAGTDWHPELEGHEGLVIEPCQATMEDCFMNLAGGQ